MDDKYGRKWRVAIIYINSYGLTMELSKIGTVGVIDEHKLANLILVNNRAI